MGKALKDLSILIPARNEIFLVRTIQDILEHAKSDFEIITVLDGQWSNTRIPQHEKVTILYYPESIGQRAATNRAASISQSKYVMKCDAHCAFADGFDLILLEDMQDDTTMVPTMRNLHAFDWVCPNGHRRYQGPSGNCTECGEPTTMDVVWIAKTNPQSVAYRFDKTLHFQYWNEYKNRQGNNHLVETMSLQGSCFLMTKDKYFELGVCDETWGSWGQQGTEVACKTWLSGGRVLVNKRTWYAHMFRTQGGDFGFPYPLSGSQVDHARKSSREILQGDKWDKAVHPFSWLVEKFSPIPDWDSTPTKGIVYYTCNTHKPEIDDACRMQLLKSNVPIVSVSLNKELDFGNEKITMAGTRSPLTMHKQILAGLIKSSADIVYLCESDVLYHLSHFEFIPKRKDVFYFNTNVWKVRYDDGHAVWTDDLQQLSGMCAYRELLIEFFTKRVEQIEREGFNNHYEPSKKQNIYPYVKGGKYGQENYQSKVCNVCIRHNQNITKSKWSVDDFKDKKYAKGWKEVDAIPGWGSMKVIMENVISGR